LIELRNHLIYPARSRYLATDLHRPTQSKQRHEKEMHINLLPLRPFARVLGVDDRVHHPHVLHVHGLHPRQHDLLPIGPPMSVEDADATLTAEDRAAVD
jgi:hypothetical protein